MVNLLLRFNELSGVLLVGVRLWVSVVSCLGSMSVLGCVGFWWMNECGLENMCSLVIGRLVVVSVCIVLCVLFGVILKWLCYCVWV